jgi:hypothetical protein
VQPWPGSRPTVSLVGTRCWSVWTGSTRQATDAVTGTCTRSWSSTVPVPSCGLCRTGPGLLRGGFALTAAGGTHDLSSSASAERISLDHLPLHRTID